MLPLVAVAAVAAVVAVVVAVMVTVAVAVAVALQPVARTLVRPPRQWWWRPG